MAEKKKTSIPSTEEVEFEETYLTRGQLVWRAFKKHRLGVLGLVVLIIMYLIAIFADFLAPYNPYTQSLNHSLIAPTKIHWKYKGDFIGPYVLPTMTYIDPFKSDRNFYVEMFFPTRIVFQGKEYAVYNDEGKIVAGGEIIHVNESEKVRPYFLVNHEIHVLADNGKEYVFNKVYERDYLIFGLETDALDKGSYVVDLNFPTAREAILNKVEFKEFSKILKRNGIKSENQIKKLWKVVYIKKFIIEKIAYNKMEINLDELLKGIPNAEMLKGTITKASKKEVKASNLQRAVLLRLVSLKDEKFAQKLKEELNINNLDVKNSSTIFKVMKTLRFDEKDGKVYIERIYHENIVDLDISKKPVDDYDYRIYKVKWFVKSWEGKLLWLFPSKWHLFGVDVPENDPAASYVRLYIMGGDAFGRDQWSRIIFASRISLSIGLIGMFITFALALIFGGISGYYGGFVDELMMRIAEIIMSIPGFYLLILLRALLPMDIPSTQIYMMLVFILSFIGWAGTSRVIRGMVLSIRQREFVEAAIVIGLPDFRVLWKHVLPNTTSFMIVAATLRIPGYILGEAGLSYLGLGIREPDASWGLMLAQAQDTYILQNAPWLLIPGAFIFVTVLAFNFVGDALRDALDPRSLG